MSEVQGSSVSNIPKFNKKKYTYPNGRGASVEVRRANDPNSNVHEIRTYKQDTKGEMKREYYTQGGVKVREQIFKHPVTGNFEKDNKFKKKDLSYEFRWGANANPELECNFENRKAKSGTIFYDQPEKREYGPLVKKDLKRMSNFEDVVLLVSRDEPGCEDLTCRQVMSDIDEWCCMVCFMICPV